MRLDTAGGEDRSCVCENADQKLKNINRPSPRSQYVFSVMNRRRVGQSRDRRERQENVACRRAAAWRPQPSGNDKGSDL